MGVEFNSFSKLVIGSLALICAILLIGCMLYLSSLIEIHWQKWSFNFIKKLQDFFGCIICTTNI